MPLGAWGAGHMCLAYALCMSPVVMHYTTLAGIGQLPRYLTGSNYSISSC